MREPMLREHSVEGVPFGVARTRKVIANLRELIDINFVPILLELR